MFTLFVLCLLYHYSDYPSFLSPSLQFYLLVLSFRSPPFSSPSPSLAPFSVSFLLSPHILSISPYPIFLFYFFFFFLSHPLSLSLFLFFLSHSPSLSLLFLSFFPIHVRSPSSFRVPLSLSAIDAAPIRVLLSVCLHCRFILILKRAYRAKNLTLYKNRSKRRHFSFKFPFSFWPHLVHNFESSFEELHSVRSD